MTREHVTAVLERLRLAYGARDLNQLADRLEMDETTFRVWLSRKNVPSHVLADASAATGRSVGWLRDGMPDEARHGTAKNKQPLFFAPQEKQINLTRQEQALLDNYRVASVEGRLALEAASAALAKQGIKGSKRGKGKKAA